MMPRRFAASAGFLAMCLLGSTSPVSAAEDADGLDEIVVSATRLQSSIRDTARAVSVIDKTQIQNATQQLGLDEALASVPGLYIQNRYNFSQDLRISLRGFGARSSFGIRGIKLIVDGIPETLPDGQAQVDSIDLGSAERVVVLRGPASSQYGNASGGVIAIDTESGGDVPFVEAGFALGELGYSQTRLKAGGRYRRVRYLVNLSTQEFDGFREQAEADGSRVNAKFEFSPGDTDAVTVVFNHTDQPLAQDPGGIDAAQVETDRRSARDANLRFDAGESLDQQRLGIVYERERDAGTLTLRNHYVWRDFANLLPFSGGGAVDIDRFFYGAGVQYTLGSAVPEALQLTFGAEAERQDDVRLRFDNNDGEIGARVFDQRERVENAAAFALAHYRIGDRWSIGAGLRYDRLQFEVEDRFNEDGDDSGTIDFDELSPSLSLGYAIGPHTLFTSYSNSFETPTTTELANPDASGGFNDLLRAQEADNFEVGYRRDDGSVSVEVVAFRIDIDNELVPFELAAFPGRTFFANAGRSERRGIESAFSWAHDSGFAVDASFTWSDFTFDAFVDENGNDFSGQRLPGLPQRFGYLGLSWESAGGLRAVFESNFSGDLFANNANDVSVDDYIVSNFRLSRAIEHGNWRVRPYIGVNNVFNERYNSNVRINAFGGRFFEPAPLRNAYAGVSVNFQPSAER